MEMPVNVNQHHYEINQHSSHSNLRSVHASKFNQDKWIAVVITILFHLSMGTLLYAGWVVSKPSEPEVRSIKVQMISLKTPAPMPQVVAELAPPEPALTVPPKVDKPIPPKVLKPTPQKADVAFKRVEEKPVVEEISATNQHNNEQLEEEKLQQEYMQKEAALQAQLNDDLEANEARQKAQQAAASKQTEAAQLANNQYLPVEKNAPAYPERALDKGLEGSCTVSYNVNTEGRVEAPQALGDCHPLFIKPSLEAAKSFKYSPRVVDGKAVVVSNVKNTFQYRIQ